MAIDTIKSSAVLDGAIATADIADDAVTGAKIENNPTIAGTLAVTGHGSVGNAGTVAGTRALTVVGASDGTGSSILVGYNSSLAQKFSVRDDGFTTVANGISLTDGNLVIGTSGKGIDFSVGASGSASSNLLDEYEEGTFTPSVGGNATYTSQIGKYVKIGRSVTIKLEMQINVLGTGSTSTVSGIPFAADTEAPLAVAKATNTNGSYGDITARIAGVNLYYMTRQGNVSSQSTNTAIHGNNFLIQVSGSYLTGS